MNLNWKEEKELLGKELTGLAYQCGCIETIFNAREPKNRREGWILKNGTNSIYYINMRNAGNSAEFTAKLGYAMGRVLEEEVKEYDIVIGADMAGVPLVSATSTSMYLRKGVEIKWGYTRPLPGEKVRTVDEAIKALEALKQKRISLGDWGGHNLIEGYLFPNCRVVIWDDMVTDFTTKLIDKKIIEYEAQRRGFDVICKDAVVGMDREQGGELAAKQNGMNLHSVIPMKTKGMSWLGNFIPPEEYKHLLAFVYQPDLYQDVGRDQKKDRNKGVSSSAMRDALELVADSGA